MSQSEIASDHFYVESEEKSFLQEIDSLDQNFRLISKYGNVGKFGKIKSALRTFFTVSAKTKILLLVRVMLKYVPIFGRSPFFQRIRMNPELTNLIGSLRHSQSHLRIVEQSLQSEKEFIHESIYGLNVDTSSNPKISLVIPTYNRSDLVFNLLRSISNIPKNSNIEIIVVDDGSEDDQFQELKKLKGVHIYHLNENVGYTLATNFGASKATGEYILLLNNDTILMPTTILVLEKYLDNNSDVWAVGPKILWQDLSIQEFGSFVDLDGEAVNNGVGYHYTHPQMNFTREVLYSSAACLLIRTEIWNLLGGFDETFAPAYYEDSDLCLRIWEKGGRLMALHNSYVIHVGSQSYSNATGSDLKSKQIEKNRKAFAKKWQGSSLQIPDKSHSQSLTGKLSDRRAVVFFDHQIPNPNRDSGQLRSYQILKTFRELGFHVIIVSRINVAHIEVVETLKIEGFEVHSSFESFFNCHDSQSKLITLFWLSKFETANFLIDRLKNEFSAVPVVFDTVDVHFIREERKATVENDSVNKSKLVQTGMSKKIDLEIFKKKELEIMRRADKVIVVSPEEHRLLTNEYEILNCSVLWKYLDRSELAIETKVDLPTKSTSVILFVGSFNHTPNFDGIEWFSREVLPDLRATAGKSFEVQVVGGGMSPAKQEFLEWQGIRVLGWVQDLAPIYESADVVIAPIRYGAGLKGKVLEAAKFGKPIVATDIAMEGFTLTPGKDYISANSANEFVLGTRDLIENPKKAKSMGSKIQSEMSKAFSKEKFTSELNACIIEVLT